jgi:MSHA biogenesis protein MshL
LKSFIKKFIVAALVLFISAGCALSRQEMKKSVGQEKKTIAKAEPATPLPAEYLIPQIEKKKTAPPRTEERFSIAVQNTNIKDVLMVLARDSRYNIVVDPDIEANVTVDLKEVTMEDALHAILSPLHFESSLQGNTIRIIRPQMETRVFSLNYITASRTGETMLSVSSGGSGGDGGGGDYGTVKTENKVALWEELRKGLNSILFGSEEEEKSSTSGQRLVISPVSGTILVTDYPEKLMEVAEFLETVEGSIQRQVMITAKIMEVTLSDTYKMGIDWAGIPNLSGSFVGNLTTGLAATQGRPASVVQQLSPDQGFFQFGATKDDFSILLDVISTQGKIHVLSSPRISTLNNQKAIIKAGREDSFFTVQNEVSSEGGVETSNFSVERSDYTIGVVLDVTPQISKNGEIIMNIHPSITEFVEEKTFPPGAVGENILANAPIIDVREIDTVVRVKNRETIVIGGLMKEKTRETVASVPFLGKIPYLGALFRRTETENENVELVILITPEVIVGSSPEESPFAGLGLSFP